MEPDSNLSGLGSQPCSGWDGGEGGLREGRERGTRGLGARRKQRGTLLAVPGLRQATVLSRGSRLHVRTCPEGLKRHSPSPDINLRPRQPRETRALLSSFYRRGNRSQRESRWAELASHPRRLAPAPEIRAPDVRGPRVHPARLLTPSASSQEVECHCRVPGEAALPSRPLLLRPLSGLVVVGGPSGSLGWNSAWPPPPGAEPRADRGWGAAAAPR